MERKCRCNDGKCEHKFVFRGQQSSPYLAANLLFELLDDKTDSRFCFKNVSNQGIIHTLLRVWSFSHQTPASISIIASGGICGNIIQMGSRMMIRLFSCVAKLFLLAALATLVSRGFNKGGTARNTENQSTMSLFPNQSTVRSFLSDIAYASSHRNLLSNPPWIKSQIKSNEDTRSDGTAATQAAQAISAQDIGGMETNPSGHRRARSDATETRKRWRKDPTHDAGNLPSTVAYQEKKIIVPTPKKKDMSRVKVVKRHSSEGGNRKYSPTSATKGGKGESKSAAEHKSNIKYVVAKGLPKFQKREKSKGSSKSKLQKVKAHATECIPLDEADSKTGKGNSKMSQKRTRIRNRYQRKKNKSKKSTNKRFLVDEMDNEKLEYFGFHQGRHLGKMMMKKKSIQYSDALTSMSSKKSKGMMMMMKKEVRSSMSGGKGKGMMGSKKRKKSKGSKGSFAAPVSRTGSRFVIYCCRDKTHMSVCLYSGSHTFVSQQFRRRQRLHRHPHQHHLPHRCRVLQVWRRRSHRPTCPQKFHLFLRVRHPLRILVMFRRNCHRKSQVSHLPRCQVLYHPLPQQCLLQKHHLGCLQMDLPNCHHLLLP